MDELSERACFINKKKPEMSQNVENIAERPLSPVLGNRTKSYYKKSGRNSSRVSLENRFIQASVEKEQSVEGNSQEVYNSQRGKIRQQEVELAQTIDTKEKVTKPDAKLKSDLISKIYEGFKTATGKTLAVSESKIINQAQTLFGDILSQNDNLESSRENKFSFLKKPHKTELEQVSETAEVEARDFVFSSGENVFTVNISPKDKKDITKFCDDNFDEFFKKNFSQMAVNSAKKSGKATEVFSNYNYNDHSTDTESLSDKVGVERLENMNDGISDTQLVYAADTAEFLRDNELIVEEKKVGRTEKVVAEKVVKSSSKSPKRKSKDSSSRKSSPAKELERQLSPMKRSQSPTKSTKRTQLKQALSKNVVDLIVASGVIENQNPKLSKNVYELHRNDQFNNITDSSLEIDSKSPDSSVLNSVMKMFNLNKLNLAKDCQGFQEETNISKEVFDRHSKVLEAVVNSMKADEEIKKQKVKKSKAKGKHREEKALRSENATKRKLESEETREIIKQESKRNRLENIDEQTVVFPDKKFEGFGFATAGGKALKVSKKALDKAKKMYDEIPEDLDNIIAVPEINKVENEQLVTVSATEDRSKRLEIQIGANNVKININSSSGNAPQIGFRSASGRDINITPQALRDARTLYKAVENELDNEFKPKEIEQERFETSTTLASITDDDCQANVEETTSSIYKDCCGLVLGSEESLSVQPEQNTTDYVRQTIQACNLSQDEAKDLIKFQSGSKPVVLGFESASGNKINISEKALQRAQELYQDAIENEKEVRFDLLQEQNEQQKVAVMFSFASAAAGKVIPVTKKSRMFDEVEELNEKTDSNTSLKSAQELITDVVNSVDVALNKLTSSKKVAVKPSTSRKHLGMSSSRSKQISITAQNLERAKLLFDDCDDLFSNIIVADNRHPSPTTKKESLTSLKAVKVDHASSTPCKSTKPKCEFVAESPNGSNSLLSINLTPIKPLHRTTIVNRNLSTIQETSSVLIMEQSSGDFNQIKADMDQECEALKRKLEIINQRKSALDLQESIIKTSADDYKSPKSGVLFQLKQQPNRIPLKNLNFYGQESWNFFKVDETILDFCFTRAHQVHFNAIGDNCGNHLESATIKTKDGAVIVPSVRDTIGLTEIEMGFRSMPSVDPKLLPENWVANHFKMIVWKLASYERVFPHYFKNVLCLENVVQQLKYRYDREIDRAERSAIRKILEKDDVSQKRLALCVSNIFETSSRVFDLELTDGWYSIRTVIDIPLCQQVLKRNILLGTKIIVQNAELLNCSEGCHPLQIPENVRLKININCTRRATWYTKLGYQKSAHPLPIRLKSINQQGGTVAYLKVAITRVYPVRFMEQEDAYKVWRNAKAEEKRARTFEAEKRKQIEQIKQKIAKEFEAEYATACKILRQTGKLSAGELAEITCPKTLCELLDASKDPESFVSLLTKAQSNSILQYKQNTSMQRQNDISIRVANELADVKALKRIVTPMMKLVVTEVDGSADFGIVLNVWRPTEEHFEMLREDSVISVYNVAPSKLGNDLTTTSRTFFKVNQRDFRKSSRQILPIAMAMDAYYKPLYNEFDTVGIIIQIVIEPYQQFIWLADFQGRLLLVKINDGPNVCALLDNFNRGETIALMNLLIKSAEKGFGQCIANHFSVISAYPQQKLIRESLELFKQQIPNDLTQLLNSCDILVEKFKVVHKIKYKSFDDSIEESNFYPSVLTSTDLALSLIDTDQFL